MFGCKIQTLPHCSLYATISAGRALGNSSLTCHMTFGPRPP